MDSIFSSWLWFIKWAAPVGLALGTTVALAQDNSEMPTLKLKYRSVLSQYKGFSEQPVAPWRATNDTVEKVGGWQVYAKDARQPDAPDKSTEKPNVPNPNGQQGGEP